MSKLLVANLKMNLTKDEIINYKKVLEESNIDNIIICPSSIHLPFLLSDKYEVGSQNGYFINKGAYTGEISFYQLKDMGINYSIIGHSERRNIFNENNGLIFNKLKSCIENNILPILCIGENKEERLGSKTIDVINEELKYIPYDMFNEIIIAYEPIWAIGTGLIPTMSEISEVLTYIKKILNEKEKSVKVLYGGSVNISNIKEICSLDNCDGVLIGGASNDPNNLINMYNEVK